MFYKVAFLSIIQGIAEFLPISSSGHLLAAEHILGIDENEMAFNVLLHFGTLISVVIFFKDFLLNIIADFFAVLKKEKTFLGSDFKIALYAVLASFPAFISVLFFENFVDKLFASYMIVPYMFLVNSLILYLSKIVRKSKFINITLRAAAIIGLLQVLALVPGISRSGITITTALILGLSPEDAFKFSFLMAIPAIAGGFIFKFEDIIYLFEGDFYAASFGVLLSALSGYVALKLLKKVLVNKKFYYFSAYSFTVGILLLLIFRH